MGDEFLDKIPKAQETKAQIDKWDYVNIKSYCTVKKTVSRIEETTYRMTTIHVT
jgi:hypothetical protein